MGFGRTLVILASTLAATGVLVALDAGSGYAASPSAAGPSPQHLTCQPSGTYKITSHTANVLLTMGKTLSLTNMTTHDATFTEEIEISGKVSADASGDVEFSEGVILESANEEFKLGVTAEIDVSQKVKASATVGPGQTVDLSAGVFRLKTIGTYTNLTDYCVTTSATVTAYSPYKIRFLATLEK